MDEVKMKIGFFYNPCIYYWFSEKRIKFDDYSSPSTLKLLMKNCSDEIWLEHLNIKKKVYYTDSDNIYLVVKTRPFYYCRVAQNKGQDNPFYENKNTLDFLYIQNNIVIKIEGENKLEFASRIEKTTIEWDMTDQKWNLKPNVISPEFNNLEWNSLYFLLVLATNKLIKLQDMNRELLNFLSEENSEFVLQNFAYLKKKFSMEEAIHMLEDICIPSRSPPSPEYALIKKILITPSAIVFTPPEYSMKSFFIRKFQYFQDEFMRVGIVNEDLNSKIGKNRTDSLNKIIRKHIEAFNIGNKKFKFLGYSNSQMRSQSYWMFNANNDGLTVDMIHEELGNFSKIRNVSKKASRIGQCFTSTFLSIDVPAESIEVIEDVERNKHVFSDGVGRISKDLLDLVSSRLETEKTISAIQIRLGGCKGVLTVDPRLSSKIQIRPSMLKFGSLSTKLEICSYSKFRYGYLNRQIITLLSGLKVPDEVFLSTQRKMLENLNRFFESESQALKILKSYSESSTIYEIQRALSCNKKIASEPFLMQFLKAFYKKMVRGVQKKARIRVKQSALLIGVLDEFEVLSYGQVYLKVSGRIITGKVVVTKNPCLHPGDIRVLEAVYVNELWHLENVLVFPQKGECPHTSQISGSDLDGDLYFITWDSELIPMIQNYEAMDYTPPKEKEEAVTIPRMINFLCDYIQKDNLGVIDNTHLAICDMHDIFDSDALELAEMHSLAVDYPKTGVPAVIPKGISVKYPDFMEKKSENSYRSEKVLGKLYRELTNYPNEISGTVRENWNLIENEDIPMFLPEAIRIENYYNLRINALLEKYSAEDEASAWIGLVKNGNNLFHRELKRGLKKQVKILKQEVKRFASRYNDSGRRALAAAIYNLCHERNRSLGLPWIFINYLV